MKSSNIILSFGLMILSLMSTTSCQKHDSIDQDVHCDACPPPTPTRSVNLEATNWTTNGDGYFRSDFSAALKKAAGEYNTIYKAYLVGSTSDVEIGYSTNVQGGTISRYGTLLIFHSQVFGQIPFDQLEIRVEVN